MFGSLFVDHELQIPITGALYLETESFWHFVSGEGVLFSLASVLGLVLLPQKILSLLLNALQWNLVTKYLLRSLPLPSHLQQLSTLSIFCFVFVPPGSA